MVCFAARLYTNKDMKQKRIPIPKKVQREILFRNEACCCVCGKSNIIIHHIDGNNSNNDLNNLAVLCLEHHDLASSKSTTSRKLNPPLVRQFKIDWESRVANRRQVVRSKIVRTKTDQDFIKFEIKRLIFSLPAFPKKESTNSILEQLYHWHLFTNVCQEIMQNLGYIRWFLKEPQVPLVLDKLWEFFWQFVDSKEIPMNKRDEKNISTAIELIGTLGVQTIILEEDPKTFDNLFSALDDFENMSIEYKKIDLLSLIKKQFKLIKKELTKDKRYKHKSFIDKKIERKIKNLSKVMKTKWS